MDELRRGSVQRLLRAAQDDLAGAQACLAAQPPVYRLVAFLAQQAAEKHLKAWLVALGDDDLPFTHNLGELVRLLADRGVASPLPPLTLSAMSDFAVRPRYGLTDPDPDEARQALSDATEVAWAAEAALRDLGALDQ